MKKKILVTGGLGFIGSHTVVELINGGFEPIIADNLYNSELFILDRINQITGVNPIFENIDLTDFEATKALFQKYPDIELVIHFAAYKAVGESMTEPIKYFKNNLISLLNIADCIQNSKSGKIVFSSSATVYGDAENLPIYENEPLKPALSAYGSTKQMGEEILEKISSANKVKAISLRYFNPVGAHPSSLIGELPRGIPNNLMPYITQTAIGKRDELTIFGNDYSTPDGTAIRDFIHVVDLAIAHVRACERMLSEDSDFKNYEVYNIGTGNGVSVLELIKAFEKVNSIKLPYVFGNRRAGDTECNFAHVSKATELLKWKAKYSVFDMVKHAWQWEIALKN